MFRHRYVLGPRYVAKLKQLCKEMNPDTHSDELASIVVREYKSIHVDGNQPDMQRLRLELLNNYGFKDRVILRDIIVLGYI